MTTGRHDGLHGMTDIRRRTPSERTAWPCLVGESPYPHGVPVPRTSARVQGTAPHNERLWPPGVVRSAQSTATPFPRFSVEHEARQPEYRNRRRS
jgi:hypothetical protein